MRSLARAVAARFAALIAWSHRERDFACGECERWQRCGLPPNQRCIVMMAQIERDGGRSRKRTLLPAC
jgi:hypothetical protein